MTAPQPPAVVTACALMASCLTPASVSLAGLALTVVFPLMTVLTICARYVTVSMYVYEYCSDIPLSSFMTRMPALCSHTHSSVFF